MTSACGRHPAEPSSYALAPSRDCLRELEGVRIDAQDVNFVASTALRGAMRVRLPTDNFADLAFGEAETEADRIEAAYRRFAPGPIPAGSLERVKNVVLLWNAPPTPQEQELVLACLMGP